MTTPSQTVGPFLAIGLPWPDGPEVVPDGTPGRLRLYGRVFDGAGICTVDAAAPMNSALLSSTSSW